MSNIWYVEMQVSTTVAVTVEADTEDEALIRANIEYGTRADFHDLFPTPEAATAVRAYKP